MNESVFTPLALTRFAFNSILCRLALGAEALDGDLTRRDVSEPLRSFIRFLFAGKEGNQTRELDFPFFL